MKNTFYVFFLLLFPIIVQGQKSDSTHTHYKLYRGAYGHFTELKSKRGVKNGEAEFYNGKKIVAKGIFKDNLKIGRWHFFKPDSVYKDYELEQIYNYTTQKLEFNQPDQRISYIIDSLKDGDHVKYPAKIGGFSAYRMFFKFQEQKKNLSDIDSYKEFHIFSINAKGLLTKYELQTTGTREDGKREILLAKLRNEDLEFVPAYLNGRSIPSTIIMETTVKVN